jgi:hypothetical protein
VILIISLSYCEYVPPTSLPGIQGNVLLGTGFQLLSHPTSVAMDLLYCLGTLTHISAKQIDFIKRMNALIILKDKATTKRAERREVSPPHKKKHNNIKNNNTIYIRQIRFPFPDTSFLKTQTCKSLKRNQILDDNNLGRRMRLY